MVGTVFTLMGFFMGQQVQLCYGFSAVHGSCWHFALCQTCQHHSLALSKAYRLLETGNTESNVMERYFNRLVLLFSARFFPS